MKKTQYTSYDQLPLMLSVPEVAAVLGISRAGAYELVRSDGLPAFRIGSRIIVPKDKFIIWLWFETYSKPNLRPSSVENYTNYIRCRIPKLEK